MLTVYSKNNCSACESAKALLKSKNIAFEVKNVDEDFEAYEFILENCHRSFPQIYEGNKLYVMGGFKGLQAKLANYEKRS